MGDTHYFVKSDGLVVSASKKEEKAAWVMGRFADVVNIISVCAKALWHTKRMDFRQLATIFSRRMSVGRISVWAILGRHTHLVILLRVS